MRRSRSVNETRDGRSHPANPRRVREAALPMPEMRPSCGQRSRIGAPRHGLTIRELPHAERPRERLHQFGAAALSTAELVSIVMGSGSPGRSSLDIGRDVLQRAGQSLRVLAAEPMVAVTAVAGVGPARAAVIHAALELGRRLCAETRTEGAPLRTSREVYATFGPRLEDLPVEEFHIGVLNAQHRLERDVTITRGILNSSLVHPREVFREAIAERAAAIVVVHNHPSGDPTPSAEDRDATAQLVAAGKLLDIPVHDHVIIGRGRYLSFIEAGFI